MSSQQPQVTPEQLAREVAELTWDLKGLNTTVIDLRGIVDYTDFLIITSGTSDRQVQAIARHVSSSLRQQGYMPLSSEGMDRGRWALLDFGDIITHVFQETVRHEFDLEGMWADAPRLALEPKPAELYGHFEMSQFGDAYSDDDDSYDNFF